jgi:hypothetical protein
MNKEMARGARLPGGEEPATLLALRRAIWSLPPRPVWRKLDCMILFRVRKHKRLFASCCGDTCCHGHRHGRDDDARHGDVLASLPHSATHHH